MRKPILLVLLFVAAVFSQGCASIISKSQYPVRITSTPSEAKITIRDKNEKLVYQGTTPTTVTLKAGAGYFSGQDYTVQFQKDGFTPMQARIQRGVDGWYVLGNIVFGGLIGWLVVDPLTGAMWTLKDLDVELESGTSAWLPDSGGTVTGCKQLKIIELSQVPDSLQSRMVRLN